MRTIASTLALFAILATTAQADWTLSGYPLPAADSSATNKLYGIRTFSNTASATKVKVDSGRVVFHADYASDSTEGNSANVGFVHELRVGEGPLDQLGLTAISFQFKSSAPITGGLAISLGSDVYSKKMLRLGAVFKNVLRGSVVTTAQSDWKTVTMNIEDFYAEGIDYGARPSIDSVLRRLTHLQITPLSTYRDSGLKEEVPCANCVQPTMASLDLQIRKIELKGGVSPVPWPNPSAIGCEHFAPKGVFDDFGDGNLESETGANWYLVTDSGDASLAKDLADGSKGASKAVLEITPGEGGGNGLGTVTSRLNRTLGTLWHKKAGWASLRTGYDWDQELFQKWFEFTAFQFQIGVFQASPSVESIRFVVRQRGVPDSASFYVNLPIAELTGEEGRSVCIRSEDLRQPIALDSVIKTRFDWLGTVGMSWDVKISDGVGGLTDTASVTFWITNLTMRAQRFIGVHGRAAPARLFTARASNGILHLSGIQEIPRLEVVSMQGRKVASFSPAPTIALDLPRGTYHLVGMHDGVRVARTFAVVR